VNKLVAELRREDGSVRRIEMKRIAPPNDPAIHEEHRSRICADVQSVKQFFTESVVRDVANMMIAPEPLLQSPFLKICFGGEPEGVRIRVFPSGDSDRRVEMKSLHGLFEAIVRSAADGMSRLWMALIDNTVSLRWNPATNVVELGYGDQEEQVLQLKHSLKRTMDIFYLTDMCKELSAAVATAEARRPRTIPLELKNTLTRYSNECAPPQATYTADGMVVLSGVVGGRVLLDAVFSRQLTLAILPERFRPAYQHVFSVRTNHPPVTSMARVDIHPDGRIVLAEGATSNWLPLDGIMFPALVEPLPKPSSSLAVISPVSVAASDLVVASNVE